MLNAEQLNLPAKNQVGNLLQRLTVESLHQLVQFRQEVG